MPLFVLTIAAVLALGIDRITKHWVLSSLADGAPRSVIPGCLDLNFTTNTGAAFGMFQQSAAHLAFVAIAAVAIIVLAAIAYRKSLTVWQGAALGLAMGGALGNLIDRMTRGNVVDFIDAYIGPHHWPTFNMADASICIGAAMLVVLSFRNSAAGDESREPEDRSNP